MLKEERHNKIIKELDRNHLLNLKEFAKKINVSEETIRKDFIALENLNVLKRTRGGAVSTDEKYFGISNLVKKNLCKKEKQYIGKLAIKYIHTKDTIFVDNSTTCIELAKLIVEKKLCVRIITNSMEIANIVCQSNNIELFILAGKYSKHSNSFMGALTMNNIENYKSDIAFVSFATINHDLGFGDNNFDNLLLRSKMISRSDRSIALMDYTKFSDDTAKFFCETKLVDMIITDQNISDDIFRKFKKSGIRIIKE
ncbi:DeoR/GlpR transcriptional regulator [Anaerococcus sp. WCA-380-WT-2B]|nr:MULTISPECIES: DeoR/GlpR family DNA-binding transcription regulator [Anaerococcus]MSS77873.1 DeoR/GlpR transcriptional regulator [Anaerococcus porci]